MALTEHDGVLVAVASIDPFHTQHSTRIGVQDGDEQIPRPEGSSGLPGIFVDQFVSNRGDRGEPRTTYDQEGSLSSFAFHHMASVSVARSFAQAMTEKFGHGVNRAPDSSALCKYNQARAGHGASELAGLRKYPSASSSISVNSA
ncbi:hypothetical protein O4160_20765 [Rhodococcus sp. IEGM 1401]|uniref:hypothetical protein n=1 Tax=unclassified Rhodococcus (in: high G+C Gram-positive bacteria) TaxID=192944 RepID=UPI0022B337CB|nr:MULTISPECIES: hypothetical protein [unclassified Rhodococcus (in: high G+C Gram-positive bacteria)]MCZ4563280.1 hypothetical protein [Rhodococcus sp. IEGM 1401]MDI9923433.1 hypothetical protein [Rhodococcus sp. IEGM 1372]MDV8035922.1 hypothetical protein [Rhodococcus sp. IEGM 1414]